MIRNHTEELLSDNWYILRKHTFEYKQRNGQWVQQVREAYDRGNGAGILLYDPIRKTILLTRQFRLPTYVNGNTNGMMIEVCAGVLDEDNPDDCIRREVEEETGYRISEVQKVMETYVSLMGGHRKTVSIRREVFSRSAGT
ncbi:MAG: NUDIX domain-containing protein [Saprospiraceae bacterium]